MAARGEARGHVNTCGTGVIGLALLPQSASLMSDALAREAGQPQDHVDRADSAPIAEIFQDFPSRLIEAFGRNRSDVTLDLAAEHSLLNRKFLDLSGNSSSLRTRGLK